MSSKRPIRVLIVDDSSTYRGLLSHVVNADPAFEVIGVAQDGSEAIRKASELRPQVISMDVAMPDIDSIEATKRIMRECPTRIVAVSALINDGDAELSMRVMAAGALAAVKKPDHLGTTEFEDARRHLLTTLKAVVEVQLDDMPVAADAATPVAGSSRPVRVAALRGHNPYQVVAIAASLGGPKMLRRLLSALPREFPFPIVAVQHMTADFTEGFASWLNDVSLLPVKSASEGDALEAGVVYMAPAQAHIRLRERGRMSVCDSPPVGGFRPSADVLFRSAAEVYGPAVLAVVLTGMGSDGLDGARAIHAGNGTIIAQDEETSVVFGMPRVVIEAGLSDAVLSIDDIAATLAELSEAN